MHKNDTLRRMVDLGKGEGGDGLETLSDTLAVAIGKTAREMFDVEADFGVSETPKADLETLLHSTPVPGLLVVLKANASLGLMAVDGLLVNALVELMTGAADNSVYKETRVPTEIDIALSRKFCTGILELWPKEQAGLAGAKNLPRLFWQQTETEAVKLEYVLNPGSFEVLKGEVRFQNGIRGGSLLFAFPSEMLASPPFGQAIGQ